MMVTILSCSKHYDKIVFALCWPNAFVQLVPTSFSLSDCEMGSDGLVCSIEEMMVKEFPFEVPEEFASKPLLKGRATVEIKVRLKDNPNIKTASLKAVLDGYSAPVTAGNFLDLVERHFYDGMEIQKGG
jgi:hypothetical protein